MFQRKSAEERKNAKLMRRLMRNTRRNKGKGPQAFICGGDPNWRPTKEEAALFKEPMARKLKRLRRRLIAILPAPFSRTKPKQNL